MNSFGSTRRKIGETTFALPVFGFGSAHLGELYARVDETVSQSTLHAAWDAGVRYYDTAPWYGRGLAEHRVGGFLRTKPRSEFQISTKVGRTLFRPANPQTFDRDPWVGGLNFEVNFDYSYDGIMRSYEQALQRLALDTIDVLVIHDLDTLFHQHDTFLAHQKALTSTGIAALVELKRSGDIQAFGMGINTTEAMETVGALVDLDFMLVAMPYTLLDQSSLHTGMANCTKSKTSVIIGAPFASGILATGSAGNNKYAYSDASPEIQSRVQKIEKICGVHNVSLPAAALQFPLAHPVVVSVIPGAARPGEVTQNVALLEEKIPDAFWSDLKSAGLIEQDAPTPHANGNA